MTLDEDHAGAVMSDNASCDLGERMRAVAAAAKEVGIRGIRLDALSLDLDIPIPLIVNVDSCSHLILEDPTGRELGRLYVDLWGEAYDRRYGARLRLVTADGERATLLEWPGHGLRDFDRLEKALGGPLPRAGLRALLVASLVPALQAELQSRLVAAGL